MIAKKTYVDTPDGRYYVSNGILYRQPNPFLDESVKSRAVANLLAARRAYSRALGDPEARRVAKMEIDEATQALGICGPTWWHDGDADLHRKLIKNTCYAEWWRSLRPSRKVPNDSSSSSLSTPHGT